MSRVQALCPACAEAVELGSEAVAITEEDEYGNGRYAFCCPSCGNSVDKPADRRIIALLRAAGVRGPVAPGEYPEHKDLPEAPPFTYDDLIDFHDFLRTLT